MSATASQTTHRSELWLDRHRTVRRIASWIGMTWTPDDEQEHTREMLRAVALAASSAGIFIFAPVYSAFGEYLAASIPAGFGVATILTMTLFRFYPNYRAWRAFEFSLFIVLPPALMISLGGFIDGSAVVIWSMLTPIGALVWGSRREAMRWFAGFLAVLAMTAAVEPAISGESDLPTAIVTLFFVINLSLVPGMAFLLLQHYVSQQRLTLGLLDEERNKSEELLRNVLPSEVAARLKDGEETIADYHGNVSVLFADVVGFTVLSSSHSPEEMVGTLNSIFSHFDVLAEKYGVEKIRTIGDGYMACSGAPVERDDHAQAIAGMALEIRAYEMPEIDGSHLQLRLGINSGEVGGGIVGTTKFHYDVCGDAVNVASRMESQGVPGKIQIGTTSSTTPSRASCVAHSRSRGRARCKRGSWSQGVRDAPSVAERGPLRQGIRGRGCTRLGQAAVHSRGRGSLRNLTLVHCGVSRDGGWRDRVRLRKTLHREVVLAGLVLARSIGVGGVGRIGDQRGLDGQPFLRLGSSVLPRRHRRHHELAGVSVRLSRGLVSVG